MVMLYNRIASLCDSKGIKAAQMCREVGIGPNTMTELKMGRVKSLSAPKLEKIAEYFGVSVSYLLGKEETPVDTLQTLKDEEKALLHSYRTMTEDQKRMMSVFIKGLKNDSCKRGLLCKAGGFPYLLLRRRDPAERGRYIYDPSQQPTKPRAERGQPDSRAKPHKKRRLLSKHTNKTNRS